MKITFKFALQANVRKVETVELHTYEEFFRYYLSYNDKGIIFDVQEVPDA